MEWLWTLAIDFVNTPFYVDSRIWGYICSSFLLCQLIYAFTDSYFSQKKWYQQLPLVERKEWESRTASTLHAVIVFVLCFYVMITDNTFWNDPVFGSNDLCVFSMAIGVGYFLSDTILILKYDIPPLVPILLHHGFAGWGFLFCVGIKGQARWFPSFLLLTEATTPFNNTYWMLQRCGMKDSKLCQVMGKIFAIFWLIFRVLINPIVLYRLYQFRDHLLATHIYVQLMLGLNIAFLLLLNNIYFIIGPFYGIMFGSASKEKI